MLVNSISVYHSINIRCILLSDTHLTLSILLADPFPAKFVVSVIIGDIKVRSQKTSLAL